MNKKSFYIRKGENQKFKIFFLLAFTFVFLFHTVSAVEKLNYGLVAYRSIENNVKYACVTWRFLSADNSNLQYNLYMAKVYSDGSMTAYTKVNTTPITTTFYKYEEKNVVSIQYVLKAVIDGVEGDVLGTYKMRGYANESVANYLEIPMKQITGDDTWKYSPNDASVADLDGDGEMEIVVHRAGQGYDNSQPGISDVPYIQAYELDGTFLWEINLGKNIREGAHYTQFMVYDLDGDGKTEVVCKTAEGTYDSAGTPVGKAYFPTYKAKYNLSVNYNENADYRNSSGYILSGPEFLTVFDGETGKEIVTTEYDPPRYSTYNNGNEIPILTPSGSDIKSRWGDNYGNRVDRFLACVANLGGSNPSVVMCRGYYTRTVLVAYDYKNKTLIKRWKFDTWSSSALSSYTGQGNHNLRVGDVDDDGFDEIVYGSMTVDNDGKGLYNTKLGHGDALHLSDYIPDRPGLEVLAVHEDGVDGTTLRDAKTGEVIYQVKDDSDVGRGIGTDIDPNSRGMEWWSSRSGGVRSAATGALLNTSTSGVSMNMACWWDGDLLRELQDGTAVTKYNYAANGGSTTLFDASASCSSNNSTKANPCLDADIVGDWREEMMLRTSDNKYVRIYMTPYPTKYRFHTFIEDHIYRMSIVYQNVAYNQPTQPGFYFGSDLENIFPNKHISVSDMSYTLNPVFDADSYLWSTGETSKTIVLNGSNYSPNIENQISLKLNFRGYEFRDTVYVKFIATGIEKILNDNQIQILNNPVADYLKIKFNIDGNFTLQIYNSVGQLCKQELFKISKNEICNIKVSNLEKGAYILNISDKKQRFSARFIKK